MKLIPRTFMNLLLLLWFILTPLVKAQESLRDGPTKQVTNAPSSELKFRQNVARIPFELSRGVIFIPVRINNSQPLWFIFDTGASVSVVAEKRAQSLGLKPKGKRETSSGMGEGSYSVSFAKNVSLNLQSVAFPQQTVTIIPFDHLMESIVGRDVDGIVGGDIIKKYVVELDYQNQIITLYARNSYQYTGDGQRFPIKIMRNVPAVRAKASLSGREPVEGDFVIDTGNGGGGCFNSPFVEKFKLLSFIPKAMPNFTAGFGGEAKGVSGRIKALMLGQYTIENPTAGFSQAKSGAFASRDSDGNFGYEVLRRFILIFDYSRSQLILEPNAHLNEPYEQDASGIFLIAGGAKFDEFNIYRITPNSAASEAGLLEGDIITAIDGRAAAELTLSCILQIFKQNGQEYLLSIKRNDKEIQTKIRLKAQF